MRNVDLDLLETFIAVAQLGSLSAAAARLHVTQGGVSQRIKRLESFFGCHLIERDAKGSTLTVQGQTLLPEARRLISANERLFEMMSAYVAPERVRIGVPFDLVGTHFPPILRAFVKRYPAVDVAMISGASLVLMEGLARGEMDLVLCQAPVTEADSAGERLSVERLVWLSVGQAHEIRPLPVCMVTERCIFREMLFERLDRDAIPWRIVFDNASIEATTAMVRTEMAVTAWLSSTIPEGLNILGPESGLPDLGDFAIELHFAKGEPSAAALALGGLIRDYYGVEPQLENRAIQRVGT
ncbi:MAG: yofA 2 [Pseudomonas sp.]|jgi:DNA-binding transcriptional LysR family regulator|uniref:LysR family transcriptional regulator n=1 Tax=Pseudomonas sp. TaxID=306 RepID=UPI0026291C9C|nr:LysR family transcriptional regulator [Pseudomonas sp.]MDB6047826.1 yofA 2 [Pseudomonas sp.]